MTDTAIVTGGSRGYGRGIVGELADGRDATVRPRQQTRALRAVSARGGRPVDSCGPNKQGTRSIRSGAPIASSSCPSDGGLSHAVRACLGLDPNTSKGSAMMQRAENRGLRVAPAHADPAKLSSQVSN
jgi:NAD(P)-dependent dehydrogenase (short-subunit alcohol dehydrogenase family)